MAKECMDVAQKFNKNNGGLNFVSMSMHDGKTLTVDKCLTVENSKCDQQGFDEAVSSLLGPKPSFIFAKLDYTSLTDKVSRSSSCLIMFVPATSTIKEKMIATVSCKPLALQLNAGTTIQACSAEEASYDAILSHILSKKSVK